MPRVEKDAEVTIVALVYRSLRWLDWMMDSVNAADTDRRYRWLIVANDAEGDVISGLQAATFPWIDHRNDDQGAPYISRTYRAWNRGVLEAPTSLVVMLNSDMFAFDLWLDELMETKEEDPQTVPTSLLVESGRIPSAMPEHVRNFGVNPNEFNAPMFRRHATDMVQEVKRVGGRSPVQEGRLYMPILVDRQEFIDVGMYPEGNPLGTTGDKDLIARYRAAGFRHVTSLRSIVYHCQEGEMRWP